MPSREAEQLADALWRTLRPTVADVLDAALAAIDEPAEDSALDGELEAKAQRWLLRRRERVQKRSHGHGKRCARSAASRKAQ
jgi:hypothetical protein